MSIGVFIWLLLINGFAPASRRMIMASCFFESIFPRHRTCRRVLPSLSCKSIGYLLLSRKNWKIAKFPVQKKKNKEMLSSMLYLFILTGDACLFISYRLTTFCVPKNCRIAWTHNTGVAVTWPLSFVWIWLPLPFTLYSFIASSSSPPPTTPPQQSKLLHASLRPPKKHLHWCLADNLIGTGCFDLEVVKRCESTHHVIKHFYSYSGITI